MYGLLEYCESRSIGLEPTQHVACGPCVRALAEAVPFELSDEQQWLRFREHLDNKYSAHGYIRLWIPGSPNEKKLNELRNIIAQPTVLRQYFDRIFAEETT